jgi:hypothetical protein
LLRPVSGDELSAVAFMAASMKVTGFDPIEATARARRSGE